MRSKSSPDQLTCQHCGNTFRRDGSRGRWPRLFCSKLCRSARAKAKIVDRFWAKVQKTDGCWLWTAGKIQAGYGILATRDNGKTVYVRAHRFSYELHYGPIPDGMEVCHNCPGGDAPACVRPEHLFLGTHADNMADMARKDRAGGKKLRGANSGTAKLTELQVRVARWLNVEKGMSMLSIANMFHLPPTTLKSAIRCKTWKPVSYGRAREEAISGGTPSSPGGLRASET